MWAGGQARELALKSSTRLSPAAGCRRLLASVAAPRSQIINSPPPAHLLMLSAFFLILALTASSLEKAPLALSREPCWLGEGWAEG